MRFFLSLTAFYFLALHAIHAVEIEGRVIKVSVSYTHLTLPTSDLV